ncbi:MAG: SLC13 family permease [Thermoplasmata archaeon]
MKLTINRLLLLVLGLLYVLISILRRSFYSEGLVDWKTIEILATLIVINTGMMLSGGIDFISYKLLGTTKSMRQLFFLSVLLTSFLAMVLTNDVTLLILIPLTVSIGKFTKKNVENIIIIQAIAANVGSMLTPFGNPQNIIIFRTEHLTFFHFILIMLPPYILSMIVLLLFVFLFRNDNLIAKSTPPVPNFFLFLSNLILLFSAIIFMLLDLNGLYFLLLIAVSLLILLFVEPEGLVRIDYALIAVFILIFLVINSLKTLVEVPVINNPVYLYLYSLLLSQFLSNVPTTVLFGKVSNWIPLAYGVDIGGNGTIIASLANLIALRNISGKNFLKFNKYSFLFLAITAAFGLFILHIYS